MSETVLKRMKNPGPANVDNFNEDTELFLFRIPNGLIDLKNLINENLEISSKKVTAMSVNGKEAEVILKNNNITCDVPWLPDSKGVLSKCSMPIKGEVTLRFPLKPSEKTDTIIPLTRAKVTHVPPPHLKQRDFSSLGPFAIKENSSPVTKKGKSIKKSSNTSLENITPCSTTDSKKKKRKREGEKLQKQFSSVYQDICNSPKVNSPKKSKKNKMELGI